MMADSIALQEAARVFPTSRRRGNPQEELVNVGEIAENDEFEDTDTKYNPEQLLLPGQRSGREAMLRKWLASHPSSSDSLNNEGGDEDKLDDDVENERCCLSNIKVTGSCICKLFVVMYLLVCLLVSALYVAIYGPNELYLVHELPPSKPIIPTPKAPPPIQFYDNPYTEWITQKWTYDDDEFADWLVLPDYLTTIQQVVTGRVDGTEGVWLLDTANLYFINGFGKTSSHDIHYRNISDYLDLNITNSSRLAVLDQDSLFILSNEEIVLLNCSHSALDYCDISVTWTTQEYEEVLTAAVSLSNKNLWIGTNDGLYSLDVSSTHPDENGTAISLVSEVEGTILSIAWRAGLAGPKGWGLTSHAFLLTNDSFQYFQDISYNTGQDVSIGIADGPGFGLLVVATEEKIYFYDGHLWWFEWVSVWGRGLGGVVDGPPVALTFVPTGELYIGNNVSLSRLNINYTFDRLGPLEGLPYHHIISLHFSRFTPLTPPLTQPFFSHVSSNGTLWIGTEKGYSLFDVGTSQFTSYHYGPRWLPGERVLDIANAGVDVFVLVTEEGLAITRGEEWTLQRKANHYQQMIERHTREPGLVADCPLTNFTLSTCEPCSTDNDGLWTSWVIAAEAFRYQVTRDVGAWHNAWSLYEGLKFLVEVTGVSGLPARSVVRGNVSTSDEWHVSTSSPGWLWKGDTSSDEIVGHLFAYTIVHDLVATTQQEKDDVAKTIDSIMAYIKTNNYTLVDVTNHTTRWGVWSPEVLNLNQSWADEHGLNSLEILSGLLSVYKITKKEDYLTAWKELLNGTTNGRFYHYGLNIINQKITFPRDVNYSDDELAFLPYFVYFYTLKSLSKNDHIFAHPEASFLPLLSLKRAWSSVKKERSAAWTSIYSYATGDNNTQLLEDLVWSLRSWPLDLVQWRTTNSHRLDIKFNPEQDRDFRSHTQSIRVLPPNERTQLRWNGNPYQLDWEGSSNEMDPGPWLMPYWLARWGKLL